MSPTKPSAREPESVYFIAEAGVNHNGDLSVAERLVDIAAESGADAVKFQTFSADRLVTEDAPQAQYQAETTDDASQSEMLRRYELSRADHEHLQSYCADRDITFLSTPFDADSADLLDDLGVPLFKVGSGELDNLPLLEHIAAFGKPMIVSTGMGTMDEVRRALEAVREVDANLPVTLLHCTSSYPAEMGDVNLRAMRTMARELDVPVGHSDHSTAVETPGFAVAAGATVVEKHFTLSKRLPGPDHRASLEPDELAASVRVANAAAVALGDAEKSPTEDELENRAVIRKSLHAAEPVEAGDTLSPDLVRVSRPADGLPPTAYERVVGRPAAADLDRGDPITEGAVEWGRRS